MGPRAAAGGGLIGPNAILQMLPVLEREGGPALRDRLLRAAGLTAPPPDTGMMPEGPAARLHQALRRDLPEDAARIAAEAGRATGDYILAHRIPQRAQGLLRRLPAPVASWMLTRAIAQHAWTFAGSGRFEVGSGRPLSFRIHDNPVVRGERADAPLCHWHVAVFERLFTELVHPSIRVRETACCAMGARACEFVVEYPRDGAAS
jgi:divinyl protochlorophyllide a 8-vinyl-reductase